MRNKAQWTLGGSVVIVASLVAILGQLKALPYVTPMTRAAHAQDVERLENEHVSTNGELVGILDQISSKIDDLERRTRCVDVSDQMLEARREMARLGDLNRTGSEAWTVAEQRLLELGETWSDLSCSQFVD